MSPTGDQAAKAPSAFLNANTVDLPSVRLFSPSRRGPHVDVGVCPVAGDEVAITGAPLVRLATRG